MTVSFWILIDFAAAGYPIIIISQRSAVTTGTENKQLDVSQGLISPEQTICSGTNATPLDGTATGSGTLTFQWESSEDSGMNWIVTSFTESSLTPTGLTTTTQYRRIVTSTLNGTSSSDTSNVITISVNDNPDASIVKTDVTCFGMATGSASATVSGGLSPYIFSWNISPVQTGTSVTDLAAGTYSLTVVDANGCTDTKTFSISQPVAPLSISAQPLPQTDCYGNHVEFSVSVTGAVGIIKFQWQQKPPSGTFTDIIGANNILLPIDNIGMLGQNTEGTQYRVVISDDCIALTSYEAILHVNSITGITPAVVNSTICSGSGLVYSLSTQGIVLNYQWELDTGSGWTSVSDGGNYSGTNTSQLKILNSTVAQSGSYRVAVIYSTLNQPPGDPTCIERSYTRTRNLVVRNPLFPPLVSADQKICFNMAPATLSATAASGGSGPTYTYIWQKSSDVSVWTNIPGETMLSYSPPVLTSTTYYRIVATDTGTPSCGNVSSSAILITVSPLPVTSAIFHR